MKKVAYTPPYTQINHFTFHIKGEMIQIASKPGIPEWNQLSPASVLIGEKILVAGDAQVLYLGCGNGAGAVPLARLLSGGRIWLHDINFVAIQMTAETIHLNQISNSETFTDINLPVRLEESCDVAIIEIPKGRKLAQRWLAQAFLGLKPGGKLCICGANRQGINPSIKDAEMLFGEPVVIGYKKGNRLVRFVKTQAAWPASGWWDIPGIAPSTWHKGSIQMPSGPIEIYSLPGIFSYDRLDEGTQLLLASIPDLRGMDVLDLGCGYGAIGLEAARAGAKNVDMLDVNLLAVCAANKNISILEITNSRALPSDVISATPDKKYNLILSNPPFHTGRDTDYQVAHAFIQQSCQALAPAGQVYFVANRFIRYEKIMQSYFLSVVEIAQSPRYHVLCGKTA